MGKKKTIIHNFAFALLPWVIPVIFMIIWIIVSETGFIPAYLMPHPLEIAQAGYTYIFENPGDAPFAGRFLNDAGASLIRVGSGFAVAVIFGLPLGIISGRISLVRKLMSTTINALRAVPGISWLPLAMIWFGIGIKTTIFLVALAAFFRFTSMPQPEPGRSIRFFSRQEP